MHCEVCGFDLYLNTAAAVAALITDQQGGDCWSSSGPGSPRKGHGTCPAASPTRMRPPKRAVRREVREELGLEITATRYLCSHPNTYAYGGMQYATLDLAFVCDVEEFAGLAIARDEMTEVLFVRPEEIDVARFGFASVGRFVEHYKSSAL